MQLYDRMCGHNSQSFVLKEMHSKAEELQKRFTKDSQELIKLQGKLQDVTLLGGKSVASYDEIEEKERKVNAALARFNTVELNHATALKVLNPLMMGIVALAERLNLLSELGKPVDMTNFSIEDAMHKVDVGKEFVNRTDGVLNQFNTLMSFQEKWDPNYVPPPPKK